MFFLYFLLVLILVLAIFIVFTTVKIEILNVKFSSKKTNERYLNKDYQITLKLYIFRNINYFKININKPKIKNEKIRNNIKNIQTKVITEKNNNKKITEILKSLKIEKINLQIEIGLEDAALTAISIGTISSAVAILLSKYVEKNNNFWKIVPIYQDRNIINVSLNSIISLRLIHIIYLLTY